MKTMMTMLAILLTSLDIKTVSSQEVPSTPAITNKIANVDWISIEWSQPPGDFIESYIIFYRYVFKACEDLVQNNSNLTIQGIDNATHSYNLTELEEYSDYTITLTAINQAGSSNPAVVIIATLETVPSSTVQNFAVESVSSTTINITWNRTPCRDRNTGLNRYVVLHYPYLDLKDIGAVPITRVNVLNEYQITRLIPRNTYLIGLRADRDDIFTGVIPGPTAYINGTTAASGMVEFFLNGQTYSNNTALSSSDIGEKARALICLTDLLECCSSDGTGSGPLGSWTLPSGSVAPSSGSSLTMSRGLSSVLLNRGRFVTAPSGIYTCEIPDASRTTRVIYFYAYPPGQVPGSPIISGLHYNNSEPAMVCISTGQLVETVSWLKDGTVIERNSPEFVQTQRIVDREEVTYEHKLRGSSSFLGSFTCIVRDGYGRSAERSLTLNGVSIIHSPLPLEVGQDESLICVSDTGVVERMEWSVNGTILASATSVSRLVLSFTPVNDSRAIHQQDFTCSVLKFDQVINQTLPVSVEVPRPAFNISIVSVSGSLVAGSVYNMTCGVSKLYSGLTSSPEVRWTSFVEGRFLATMPSVIIGENVSTAVISFNPVHTLSSGGYVCVGSLESPILTAKLTTRLREDVTFQIPAPEVSIVESEFVTTDGTSSVVLNCSAMVDTTDLTFGTVRYRFTWRRENSFLQEETIAATSTNEAKHSQYTLQSPGVFSNNFTCTVRALEKFNRLLPSTATSNTKVVTVTVAESCLMTSVLINPVELGVNLTCSIELCPFLLTITSLDMTSVNWTSNGSIINQLEPLEMIGSSQFQSVLMLSVTEVGVNYSCEVTVPYRLNGPNVLVSLKKEAAIIPTTSLYLHFCMDDHKEMNYSSTQLLALEATLTELLTNCSSDVSDLNLRDEMFEFSKRSIIYTADLLGVSDMSGIELRECLLEQIPPRISVHNVSLEVVCTTRCTSVSACRVTETTSVPDLTTMSQETTGETASLGIISPGTAGPATTVLPSTVQTSQKGVPDYVIVIIVVVAIVLLAILLAVVFIVIVYYKRRRYHPIEKKQIVISNIEYVCHDLSLSSKKEKEDAVDLINGPPEKVSTFIVTQNESQPAEDPAHVYESVDQ